jgi:signal transduction histidine kinase
MPSTAVDRNPTPVTQRSSHDLWFAGQRKLLTAGILACLLLVGYIGYLVVANYRNQVDLREASLKRFHLDLQKRAVSLGYFFSERKSDLNALALSPEINSYFVNKAMGMSEQYGLKVNLFMIQQLLKKTRTDRHVQGDPIYRRLALLDRDGNVLADTAEGVVPPPPIAEGHRQAPHLYFNQEDQPHQLMMTVSCKFRRQTSGNLVVWLDEDTIYAHFVDLNIDARPSDAGLIDGDGHLHCRHAATVRSVGLQVTPEWLQSLPPDGLSELTFESDGEAHELMIACLPIHNLNLRYIAWVSKAHIAGGLASREVMLGMGVLAVVVLTALALIIRFSAQNLILKARFDEAAKQQDALAFKNRQLEEEIERREEAERELAAQRTLRMRSDRLRSLGEMAAGIAHELNQPLVGVRGYAELMIDSLDEGLPLPPEQIRSHTGTIVEQADRMVHIINHVRMFARDADSVETAVVDLNEVVRSGLSLLTAQFNSHGLLLEKEIAEHPLPVRVNAFSVEEVLLNMLSNARHAVEHQQEMEGDTYQPCVRVITLDRYDDRNEVCVVVEDNGGGIPADAADRVFDPFFTTKGPDQGTGLGLSISKSIVESFHGRIRFTTEKDRGTQFEIVFPKCTEQDG